jgi:hypothetical protein
MTIALRTAEKENFQTPHAALAQHQNYQSAYGNVLARRSAVHGRLVMSLVHDDKNEGVDIHGTGNSK